MTHNLSSTRSNITAENQSPKLQEISFNNNKLYLEQENKQQEAALTFLKKENSDQEHGSPYSLSFNDKNNIKEEGTENEINKNVCFCNEKLNNSFSLSKKNSKKEMLPRYGLCEKSTQTFLTSREIDDLEFLKTTSPQEVMLGLFKSSPDMLRKICGKNLNFSPFNFSAENYFASATGTEKNFENFKSYFTSRFENKENSSKSCDSGKKITTTSKKKSFENKNENEVLQNNLISRKRKIPLDYNDFNKNGLNEKNLQIEKQGKKIKIKEGVSMSNENSNFENNGLVGNFFSVMSNEETNNTNNLITQKSTNQIFIKRKFDNKRKNKLKHGNNPHLHFASKTLIQRQSSIEKNGITKNKKINNKNENLINNNNLIIPDSQNNENKQMVILQSNNFTNNNLDDTNLNNYDLKDLPKNLNLNESDLPSSSKEKGFSKKKIINSQKNSSTNLIEKIKNSSAGNENLFSSVNEDFSKSSYEPSLAKGISSFNEDLNEINNALGKDFSNEIEILKETETKFGRGRPKNILGKVKECQINWKNMDKDLKAVYFRMAEHEKKIFKKVRKMNMLMEKEKQEE